MSENAICTTYKVSRDTARKSLAKLENDGLIYSRPKVGYFVQSPKHSSFMMQLEEDLPGCVTRYRDIKGMLPDQRIQKALQISSHQKVIALSQIIINSEDVHVAYEIKYIPYERSYPSVESEIQFAVFPELTFTKMESYMYYTNLSISATVATAELAEILKCNEGEPLLQIERIYTHQNDSRIGYTVRYVRHPYAQLKGISGYVRKDLANE